jgi:glycosyltransferase involved in cell wall biosynthesis
MEVSISVPGKFHAFDLAEGLHSYNSLYKITTSYPKFKLPNNLPDSKVSTISYPEAIYQIGDRFHLRNYVNKISKWNSPFVRWKFRLFDKSVARKLDPAPSSESIFVGFAGACLQSIRRANELGYTTIVERSSVDIRTQRDLLSKEFEISGNSKQPISEHHIQIEEQEYEIADYIVVCSNFAADSFKKRGYSDKVVNIPLGNKPERAKVKRKIRPTNVSKEEDVFLYAGAVSLQKGIPYLLDAWESAELEQSHLVLVGSIDSEIKDQIDLTNKNVHLVGWQDNIDEWYAGSDYFVFPSMQDGFGQVVLEALFHGLPVVVSENTGAKDCVRDGIDGLIVQSGDPEALKDALEKLDNIEWTRDEIAKYARKNYSTDEYIKNVVTKYNRIVNIESEV